MASIRTARVLAAVAALPLAVALCSGVASADTGIFADNGGSATVASIIGSGVGGSNTGTSNTNLQLPSPGGTALSNVAGVNGSAPAFLDQDTVSINFTPLWW